MKINKLAKEVYGDKTYKEMLNNKFFDGWESSCTGKTTALILYYIADALDNPGVELHIREPGKDYTVSCKACGMVDQLLNTIEQLGLRFMKFNRSKGTLTYELFEEVDVKEFVSEQSELDILKEKLVKAATDGDLEAVTAYSQAIQRIKSVGKI